MLLDILPEGTILDGELYNHTMIFEDLTSSVRTKSTLPENNDKIECFLFDLMIFETPLEDRITLLKEAYLKLKENYVFTHLFVIVHVTVHSHNEILELRGAYESTGYEGVMVRKLLGPNGTVGLTKKEIEETWYKSGRNNDNLLKYKQFIDEEGTIIGYKDGEGREKGLVIWTVRDDQGGVFDVRPKGSFEQRAILFQNADKDIGRRYTYRYFEKTEYGLPRFPIGIGFRDYEGEPKAVVISKMKKFL